MNGFIELTDKRGVKFMLNVTRVIDVYPAGEDTRLTLDEGSWYAQESYDDVKALIYVASKK